MYACFDQPDLKATFALQVHAPAGWTCVSGGAVVDSPAEGKQGRWRFATMPRVSTYITALVAGPYASVHDEHDGIALGLYCRASLAQHLDAEELFTVTKQGFDFFHEVFDYRYPFGKYDQLFVPGVQRRGDGERRGGDVPGGLRLPLQGHRRGVRAARRDDAARDGAHVVRRPRDDALVGRPVAERVLRDVHVGARPGQATRWTNAWTTFANAEKTWAYRQDQLPSTHPIAADIRRHARTWGQLRRDHLRQGRLGAQAARRLGRPGRVPGRRCAPTSATHEYGNTVLADLLRRARGRQRPGAVRLGRAVAARPRA